MFIKSLEKIPVFIAGDETQIREVLHPSNDNLNMNYSLAHAALKENESSLLHFLNSSEVYYILEGEGLMYVNGEQRKVVKNDIIWVPAKAEQFIKNTGKGSLSFLCIVDPAWKKEDEIIL